MLFKKKQKTDNEINSHFASTYEAAVQENGQG